MLAFILGSYNFNMWRPSFPPDIMPISKVAQIMCIFLFDALGFAAAPVAAAILLMENTFDGKCNNPQKSRKKGKRNSIKSISIQQAEMKILNETKSPNTKGDTSMWTRQP